MPLTTAHALLPIAGAVAFCDKPFPWKLVIAAVVASAAPDLDGMFKHLWTLPAGSILLHRGATHSLFTALAVGLIASRFARSLEAKSSTAGIVVSSAMATHGLLDMMADTGRPVAYLWPLTSVRLFADWRPILSDADRTSSLLSQGIFRLGVECVQLLMPMLLAAVAIRGLRHAYILLRSARLR